MLVNVSTRKTDHFNFIFAIFAEVKSCDANNGGPFESLCLNFRISQKPINEKSSNSIGLKSGNFDSKILVNGIYRKFYESELK